MTKVGWTGIFFALIGGIFAVVGGVLLWMEVAFGETSIAANGTVADFDTRYDSDSGTMYSPVVAFLDQDGELHRFTSNVSSSSRGYDVGEQVEVIYDPDNPSSARIDSFWERYLLPAIFTGMGSLFVLIGSSMALYPTYRRRAVEKLKTTGVQIEGTVTRVYQDRRIAVNGESPWRVEAQGGNPRTGAEEIFSSDAIWGQPFGIDAGDTVPVFLSPTNSKKHFVDSENAVPAPRTADAETGSHGGHWRFGQKRTR